MNQNHHGPCALAPCARITPLAWITRCVLLACILVPASLFLASCGGEDITVEGIRIEVAGPLFRPALQLTANAEVTLDYGDSSIPVPQTITLSQTDPDTGNIYLAPHTFADGAATHTVTLQVQPWSALKVLNLGFRAGDGGNNTYQTDAPVIAFLPSKADIPGENDWDTLTDSQIRDWVGEVRAISNIQVATDLQALACERQALTEIDCSGMSTLRTLEAFYSQIKSTNFQGCTQLRRCCLEQTGANASWRVDNGIRTDSELMDLRDSPLLQDLRGTGDNHTGVWLHSDALDTLWHFCKMANSRMQGIQIGSEAPAPLDPRRFKALTQLWVSYSPVLGNSLIIDNGVTNSVWASCSDSGISTLDVHNQTQLSELELNNNQITSLNITGCTGLDRLTMHNCGLSQTLVDAILADMDAMGERTVGSWCFIDLSDDPDDPNVNHPNAAPSVTGLSHVQALRSRGWTVSINQ